jgi:ZIP family zinc transporter
LSAFVAGVLASLACGLGVLPLAIPRIDPARHQGLGYAFAGGLMFSASVYNLILPGLALGGEGWHLDDVLPIIAGLLLGAAFLAGAEGLLSRRGVGEDSNKWSSWGGRVGLLVFLTMTVHSIPEGVAVGVGFTMDALVATSVALGPTLALAIAIHNIPEGLAVGIPMRGAGASLWRCFWAAVATSLPQPIAAVPAVLLAWFFAPLMPLMMGFAAGAMIFLIILELIPEALSTESPLRIAWAFTLGFCLMLLIQVVL